MASPKTQFHVTGLPVEASVNIASAFKHTGGEEKAAMGYVLTVTSRTTVSKEQILPAMSVTEYVPDTV